jgi:cytoskeletal protein RodZ
MTEFKPLKEIIRDEMRTQGINVQKLAEITGIAPRYIKALLDNDLTQLPAAPYVRGYLENIAKVLEIDAEPLWQEYQKESDIKRSGEKDRLPVNRYAQRPFNKTAIVITIVILITLAFLVPKISDFLGQPSLEITSPSVDGLKTSNENFILSGKIGNPQDKLTINSSEVIVSADGTFQQPVFLSESGCYNDYEFTVKRFLGLSTTARRTICYIPPASTESQQPAPTQ